MNGFRQVPELLNLLTKIDDKRIELEESLVMIGETYDTLSDAGADGYEPHTDAERALVYLARNTLVPQMMLAKANHLTNIFIQEVKDVILAIEALDAQ